MTTFSERLVELRKCASLTQKQLADATGMNVRGIQFYEAGRIPDYPSLIKLADFFNCSLDYLVGRSDNPERR